jgi:hypothetical protein
LVSLAEMKLMQNAVATFSEPAQNALWRPPENPASNVATLQCS